MPIPFPLFELRIDSMNGNGRRLLSNVSLSGRALDVMSGYRQMKKRSKEAGGQLFAEFRDGGVVIVEATTPKWLDYRGRDAFRPNRWIQQREIRQRYRRGWHFIGDWHTHPEPVPKPSQVDIESMQECFRNSRHDLTGFLLIILGTLPPPTGLYVGLVTTDEFIEIALTRHDNVEE